MKTTVKMLDDGKAELTVEIDADTVSKAVDDEYRRLADTVKIPGFRQGKVPREVLERHVGVDAVSREVVGRLVPETYPQALDEAELRPIEAPQVRLDDYKQGEPLVYHATIEVEPEAMISGYSGIEITVPPSTATEEEIGTEIDRLRVRHSRLDVVEGRPVAAEDFVLIDFTGYLDDIPFEGGAGTDFLLEIGSGRFLPGFEDGLVGAEAKENRDIWIDVPGDYQGQEIAGKRVRFETTVKEIKHRELPEIDDSFAAEASEFDTLLELRSSLRGQIEDAKQRAVQVRGQGQILDRLEALVQVDVPPKMIALKHEQLLKEFLNMLQSQGLTLEEYFRISESTEEALREAMEREALRRVREELALEAVARQEKITVPDAEIEDEISTLSERVGEPPAAVRARLEQQGSMGELKRSVLRRKTLEWLSERASVTIEQDEPATPEPEAALAASEAKAKRKRAPRGKVAAETSEAPVGEAAGAKEG